MHVVATTVGDFPDQSSGSLAIENEPGTFGDLDVHLLLFPGDYKMLTTDRGYVQAGGRKQVNVPPGILNFSGGKTASLPRLPSVTMPQFEVLFSFDKQALQIPVSISADSQSVIVRADKECYAAVKYSGYITSARRLTYTPLLNTLPGGGVSVEHGVIAVFREPDQVLTHQVDPFSINDQGNAVIELYRIVSEKVTTPEGEFQKPPNYPTDGNYPSLAFVLDVSVSLLTERVHEIGYMDDKGRGWVNTYHQKPLEPYEGSLSYEIPLIVRKASITQYPVSLQLAALNFIKARGYGPKT